MSEKPNEPIEGGTPEESENNSNTVQADTSVPEEKNVKPKEPLKVSLFSFVLTTVSLVLAAVMITFTVSSAFFKKEYIESQIEQTQQSEVQYSEKGYPFELFSRFLDVYSFAETDEEAMMAAALKAYVAESGDRYAYYYTADEYSEYISANIGESQGIGINIIKDDLDEEDDVESSEEAVEEISSENTESVEVVAEETTESVEETAENEVQEVNEEEPKKEYNKTTAKVKTSSNKKSNNKNNSKKK